MLSQVTGSHINVIYVTSQKHHTSSSQHYLYHWVLEDLTFLNHWYDNHHWPNPLHLLVKPPYLWLIRQHFI